jgi:hypothetical protein
VIESSGSPCLKGETWATHLFATGVGRSMEISETWVFQYNRSSDISW